MRPHACGRTLGDVAVAGYRASFGSQLKGGTLSATLDIAGPVDKLVITGPMRLANTSLAGFNLGAKMGAMSAFAGKAVSKPDTSISNLSFNARVVPEGTQADNINLDVPALGVITGAGTVSPAGALNFKMLANLSGGMAGGLARWPRRAAADGIPFAIQGTTSDPKFVPDIGGMAESLAKGALQGVIPGKAYREFQLMPWRGCSARRSRTTAIGL